MKNVHSVSSQWRNAWLIKNTGIFIKILIGQQVSHTWWSSRQEVEVVSSPLRTSSSGFTTCVHHKKERAGEGMQRNFAFSISSADLSACCRGYWAFLALAEGSQLSTSSQQSPLWGFVVWGLGQLPGATVGCSIHQPQLPEQIHTHSIVIIDNYHHYCVVTEMCWALGQSLVLVSLQRGKQCSSALWCDIQVSRNDQAF